MIGYGPFRGKDAFPSGKAILNDTYGRWVANRCLLLVDIFAAGLHVEQNPKVFRVRFAKYAGMSIEWPRVLPAIGHNQIIAANGTSRDIPCIESRADCFHAGVMTDGFEPHNAPVLNDIRLMALGWWHDPPAVRGSFRSYDIPIGDGNYFQSCCRIQTDPTTKKTPLAQSEIILPPATLPARACRAGRAWWDRGAAART